MEDYQKRVIEEKKELDERIEKLSVFLKENKNIPYLDEQYRVMQEYSKILDKRINIFE